MAHPPALKPLSEADYAAIEDAVMETARGRWFLDEYAKRNRHADTKLVLGAIDRLEAVIRGQRGQHGDETVDRRFRFDILEMAKTIARTKAEIASIKPDGEHHGKFGEATEELDSIVGATETATSDILAAAEHIQEIAWTLREQGLEAEVCDLIDAKAVDVYTACSFQDLTGQRSRKVIQVLRYLEGRINAMIDIWGLGGEMAAEHAEIEKARAGEAALRDGAVRPDHGLNQADIDVVLGPATAVELRSAHEAYAPLVEPIAAPVRANANEVPAAQPEAQRAPSGATGGDAAIIGVKRGIITL